MTVRPVPPVLVEVTRAGFVESRHRGQLVLVDAAGTVQVSTGGPEGQFFPRSALKPLQAIAMLECGLDLPTPSLALAAASHDAEPMHVDGVRLMLAAAGLAEDALQCPPAGTPPERIRHNCSGKHAAMLTTCLVAGWAPETYRSFDHPLQQVIRDRVGVLCGEPVERAAVDGCGAPALTTTLEGLARAYSALGVASSGPAAAVAAAMRTYPVLVSGSARVSGQLPAEVPGLIAKEGAEGVWGACLPDGRAFAAKLEDGAERALPAVLAAVVRAWGFSGPLIDTWAAMPTLGGGQPVGEIRPSAELVTLLGTDE